MTHRHVALYSFFFSSRRRHTRWPRDWSSDVCSSDLEREAGHAEREATRIEEHLATVMEELETAESEIAAAFGGRVPADPVAVLDGRLGHLEDLDRSCDGAELALAEAKDERVVAERERDGLIARAAEVRGRLGGLSVSGLAERA